MADPPAAASNAILKQLIFFDNRYDGEYHETDPPFIMEADPGLIIEIDPPLIM
jgi:hypothetical protein